MHAPHCCIQSVVVSVVIYQKVEFYIYFVKAHEICVPMYDTKKAQILFIQYLLSVGSGTMLKFSIPHINTLLFITEFFFFLEVTHGR